LKIPNPVFLLLLLLSVALAWVVPEWGRRGGLLRSELLIPAGVVFIFFTQGLLLPRGAVPETVRAWPVHGFTQVCIYLLFPALTWAGLWLAGDWIDPDLQLGMLYLAILPTTIATAVIFATQAGGSIPTAIFNSVLSNVLAVVIVPVVTAWLLEAVTGMEIVVWPILQRIALLIVLPLAVGTLMQPLLRARVEGRRDLIRKVNNGIIFFAIYAVFCDSVVAGFWAQQGVRPVVFALLATVLLLGAINLVVFHALRVLRFGRGQMVSAFFCATQKSIATGIPMAHVIFAPDGLGAHAPNLGLVLLPLMLYHPMQLFLGGILIGLWKRRAAAGGS